MWPQPKKTYRPPTRERTPPSRSKKSVYLPEEILQEIEAEAARLDRSVSWVIKQSWLKGREHITSMAAPHVG